MMEFLTVVAGYVAGVCIGGLIIIRLSGVRLRQRVSTWMKKMSLVESMNLLKKLTWRDFLESMLRAQTGKSVKRPFGTNIHFFKWDRFQFNPVYLSNTPLSSDEVVNTEVVLGPLAKKPLRLSIPIMIGGMSYGSSLSFKAKIALAKAASLTGTATNTGSGPYMEEEREAADKLILQLSRGFWSRSDKILSRVDMIEISLGHGAWGPAPVRVNGKEVTNGFAGRIGAIPGLDVIIESRLPEVETREDWRNLIRALKEVSGGVPIAVKIGGTHTLEKELDIYMGSGVDIIVMDGAEGGTHACPVILLDDVGLPTLPSLCRTVKFFEENDLFGKVSLVAGGGLATPGDFLKCLALGADAVIIGTIASLVMSHTQVTKAVPWEPPTEVIYYGAKKQAAYNEDLGAKHLHYFFLSCIEEMKLVARSLGKKDLRDFNKSDMVALDPVYAKMSGVPYIGDVKR